jgi:AraC-like DNA-binding protein
MIPSPGLAASHSPPKAPIVIRSKEYEDGHVVPPHDHQRAQLIFAAKGVMEVTVAKGMFLVPPQRAVWIPSRTQHQMRARGHVAFRTVYIWTDFCPPHLPAEPRTVQVSGLLRELILRASGIPVGAESEPRNARMLQLLVDEIEVTPERALHLPTGKDPRLAKICDALLANPGDDKDLADWAGLVGASTRTLARLFQAEMGISFVTWRQQLRVLAALPRLAAGEPVTVVALDLGYETQGAFAEVFRRILGSTPSTYFSRASGSGRNLAG